MTATFKPGDKVIAEEYHSVIWSKVYPGDSLTVVDFDLENGLYKVRKGSDHPVWLEPSAISAN